MFDRASHGKDERAQWCVEVQKTRALAVVGRRTLPAFCAYIRARRDVVNMFVVLDVWIDAQCERATPSRLVIAANE